MSNVNVQVLGNSILQFQSILINLDARLDQLSRGVTRFIESQNTKENQHAVTNPGTTTGTNTGTTDKTTRND